MKEIWKDIDGFEGLYQVSNLGNVKSLSRTIRANTCGVRILPERLLAKCVSSCGYYVVILCKYGKHYTRMVHRLVAMAFIDNPNNEKEVNHKDENKLNNCAQNLEWCDRRYNANYGTGAGRCGKQKWKPVVMLNKNTKRPIRVFESLKKASSITGIDDRSISSACRGRIKTAGGFCWKYKL